MRLPGYAPTPLHDVPELAEAVRRRARAAQGRERALRAPGLQDHGRSVGGARGAGRPPRRAVRRLGDARGARRPGGGRPHARRGDRRQPRPRGRPHGRPARAAQPHPRAARHGRGADRRDRVGRARRSRSSTAATTRPSRRPRGSRTTRTLVVSDTAWEGYEDIPTGGDRGLLDDPLGGRRPAGRNSAAGRRVRAGRRGCVRRRRRDPRRPRLGRGRAAARHGRAGQRQLPAGVDRGRPTWSPSTASRRRSWRV